MRIRHAVLPAVLATVLAGGITPAAATPLVVIDRGHVDAVDVEYVDGAFELHVHDETVDPPVERDPADVIFGVRPGARTTVPDDAAYRFLGAPGAPVWILPEVQSPDLLWPGLSTEELESGVFTQDSVTLTLCRVRGPGAMSVYTSDPFGAPQVLFNSRDGLPDRLTLPTGSHQHVNWAFTAAGTYRLTVRASATLASGGTVVSDPVVLTFRIQ